VVTISTTDRTTPAPRRRDESERLTANPRCPLFDLRPRLRAPGRSLDSASPTSHVPPDTDNRVTRHRYEIDTRTAARWSPTTHRASEVAIGPGPGRGSQPVRATRLLR
jgi:hypothetical protein